MTRWRDPFARRRDEAPVPAFMKIEGRLARPLPSESAGSNPRKFWLVQPWIIAALVMLVMAALMLPGLLLELARPF